MRIIRLRKTLKFAKKHLERYGFRRVAEKSIATFEGKVKATAYSKEEYVKGSTGLKE